MYVNRYSLQDIGNVFLRGQDEQGSASGIYPEAQWLSVGLSVVNEEQDWPNLCDCTPAVFYCTSRQHEGKTCIFVLSNML